MKFIKGTRSEKCQQGRLQNAFSLVLDSLYCNEKLGDENKKLRGP
jgi:hypothetical protein